MTDGVSWQIVKRCCSSVWLTRVNSPIATVTCCQHITTRIYTNQNLPKVHIDVQMSTSNFEMFSRPCHVPSLGNCKLCRHPSHSIFAVITHCERPTVKPLAWLLCRVTTSISSFDTVRRWMIKLRHHLTLHCCTQQRVVRVTDSVRISNQQRLLVWPCHIISMKTSSDQLRQRYRASSIDDFNGWVNLRLNFRLRDYCSR